MTEPTVQVPVSLIERAAKAVLRGWDSIAVHAELTALLSQPTPTAEPKPDRCPSCRHAAHAGGVCLNMASDNDCACTYAAEPNHRVTILPVSEFPEDTRLTLVADCTVCGWIGTWPDTAEGNDRAQSLARVHAAPTAPPQPEDMAPGTTDPFANRPQVRHLARRHDVIETEHGTWLLDWYYPTEPYIRKVDPSTIRDVTPPTESTK